MAVNTVTLQNLRDIFYAILKEFEDTSAYPLVLADSFINDAQNGICEGSITDLNTGTRREQIEKGPLPFLFSDEYYTSSQDTFLTTEAIIGGNILETSNTVPFLDSGSLWINEDLVKYTAKTATDFTGVTGIDFKHKEGSRVSQLYVLPDDYATSVRVIYNNQFAMENKDYRNLYLMLNQYKGFYGKSNVSNDNATIDRFPADIPPFYTIINGEFMLPFQISQSDRMIHMIYERVATEMVDGTDVTTIPDRYAKATIPYFAVSEMLYNRGEEDRALKVQNMAIGKLMQMYSFYANQNNEDLNGQRVRTGKDQILNI